MAPTITSATRTLVENQEVSFGTIVSPTGFDFVDVFVDGRQNPDEVVEFRLYEIIGGLATLVATAPGGGPNPCILDWGPGGASSPALVTPSTPTPYSPASGAGFTFELRAIWFDSEVETPPTFLASLVGYDEFDVVGNADSGPVITVQIPTNFTEVTIATLPGYAQSLDVSIAESFNVPIRFTLYAQAGVGGVVAEVASIVANGVPGNAQSTIARILSPSRLPGATAYILRARFDTSLASAPPQNPVFVSAGMTTHSRTIATGGVVALLGDVIGPSNANTVIKWNNVPLLLAGPNSFALAALGDASFPIFDLALGTWRSFPITGAITVNNAGVATLSGGAVLPLAGNANGPSNANDVIDFGIESTDTAVVAAQFVPISSGRWYVGMKGLAANRGVQLDDAFPPGSRVTIKDEDGSLASFDIPVTGSTGDTIDGLATYTLDVASPGPFGSVTIEKNFNGPSEWSVVVQ